MKNNQYKQDSSPCSSSNPRPVYYQIQIQGKLDPQRSAWFEGMNLSYVENGEGGLECTLIEGPVIDQPALYGLLTKIRDLNLTLICVRRSIPGTGPAENVHILPERTGDQDD